MQEPLDPEKIRDAQKTIHILTAWFLILGLCFLGIVAAIGLVGLAILKWSWTTLFS